MKILVCVKQVLDPDGPVRIDSLGQSVAPAPESLYRMNRFDEYALEAALRIRDQFPAARVHALTAGPERAARTVRRALETGADEGIHLLLDDHWRTPFETAWLIGSCIRPRNYDLILTGIMAEDDMQAQVGPMLAEMLGYPWATAVMALQAAESRVHPGSHAGARRTGDAGTGPDERTGGQPDFGRSIRVERELEGGCREVFELTLPALLAVQSGIHRPRYPALSHVLRARTQPLVTIPASPLSAVAADVPPQPRERILHLEEPVATKTALMLPGSPGEKAERLLGLLRERNFL